MENIKWVLSASRRYELLSTCLIIGNQTEMFVYFDEVFCTSWCNLTFIMLKLDSKSTIKSFLKTHCKYQY